MSSHITCTPVSLLRKASTGPFNLDIPANIVSGRSGASRLEMAANKSCSHLASSSLGSTKATVRPDCFWIRLPFFVNSIDQYCCMINPKISYESDGQTFYLFTRCNYDGQLEALCAMLQLADVVLDMHKANPTFPESPQPWRIHKFEEGGYTSYGLFIIPEFAPSKTVY